MGGESSFDAISGRYFRINTVLYNTNACFRMELYGCAAGKNHVNDKWNNIQTHTYNMVMQNMQQIYQVSSNSFPQKQIIVAMVIDLQRVITFSSL